MNNHQEPIVTDKMIAAAEAVEDLYRRGTPDTWRKVFLAMWREMPTAQSQVNRIADLVKAYDQKLLDAERILQESNSTWHRLLTLEEARVKELEQAASINQEYVAEMHRINNMAISAGLEVPNPNSPYFSERSAVAYLQRQSYEQGWKDGNNDVKLMDHKD